jgi:hypothetical protein
VDQLGGGVAERGSRYHASLTLGGDDTISTRQAGLASFASTVARGGVWPCATHSSQTVVHAGEVRHVGDVDLAAQDAGLVAAGFGQQAVDVAQHFAGLAGDVLVVSSAIWPAR